MQYLSRNEQDVKIYVEEVEFQDIECSFSEVQYVNSSTLYTLFLVQL